MLFAPFCMVISACTGLLVSHLSNIIEFRKPKKRCCFTSSSWWCGRFPDLTKVFTKSRPSQAGTCRTCKVECQCDPVWKAYDKIWMGKMYRKLIGSLVHWTWWGSELANKQVFACTSFDAWVVKVMDIASVCFWPMLSGQGGKVHLHGRLFAEWLHVLVPYQCPWPNPRWEEDKGGTEDASSGKGDKTMSCEVIRILQLIDL